jgi:hypothetical protein
MLRGFVTIVLSVILGALLAALMTNLAIYYGFVRVDGGGALPTPNLDKVLIPLILGFFGGIYGLLTSSIALILIKQRFIPYPIKAGRTILFIAVCGLAHSLVFGLLEIDNDLYGRRPPQFSDIQIDVLITTVAIQLIAGCLIAATSVLLTLFITKGFNNTKRA